MKSSAGRMTLWAKVILAGLLLFGSTGVSGFLPSTTSRRSIACNDRSATRRFQSSNSGNEGSKGDYTIKQRLREEIESPFRTVRVYFFGASTVSALVALYFSLLALGKASAGGFADAPPLDEAIQSVGINVGALLLCAGITWRDYRAGQANLARIKQGGALASLVVERMNIDLGRPQRSTLADFRRNSRVLIAAGGREYIQTLCRSLNADQLADANTLPAAISAADLIVVPVLLESGGKVGDSITCWGETEPVVDEDRNFDVTRAAGVTAFPRGPAAWSEVLAPEIATAEGQGFDVSAKGITLILKKNGKILRRATGQPQWSGLLGTMDVFDKNFGMPGDDAVYGGKRSSGDSL